MFEPMPRLLLGLFTGFLFGVLLQKGRVAKYRVIVGQFLLKDWTVVKVMGTAVVVGAAGIFVIHSMDFAAFHIKPLMLGGVLLGGGLFGIGMGLLGYCPGTCIAACGEGRRDAVAGLLGQLLGAGTFIVAYPWLAALVGMGDFGKIAFPNVTQTSPWLWVVAIAAAGLLALYASARPGRNARSLRQAPSPKV